MYEIEGKSHISADIYSYEPLVEKLKHNDPKDEYKVIKTLTETIYNNFKDNILYLK